MLYGVRCHHCNGCILAKEAQSVTNNMGAILLILPYLQLSIIYTPLIMPHTDQIMLTQLLSRSYNILQLYLFMLRLTTNSARKFETKVRLVLTHGHVVIRNT